VNLGGTLFTQGRLEKTLSYNLDSVKERPDDALAHSQLGLNYYYLGQLPEAEEHLKIAISLDPGHFSYPQLPLAEIYIRGKDYSAAAREIDRFLSLHPDATQSEVVKKRIDRFRSDINQDGPQ
jgi:tetratricopeptide (TPR) repeat protein